MSTTGKRYFCTCGTEMEDYGSVGYNCPLGPKCPDFGKTSIHTEPLAPLTDARVRELSNLARCGPDVVALAQEVARSRKAVQPTVYDKHAAMRVALEKFAAHSDRMRESDDFSYMGERIKDWFGVSDFEAAAAALVIAKQPDPRDERIAALEAENAKGLANFDRMYLEAVATEKRLIMDLQYVRLVSVTQHDALCAIALALGLPADAAPDAVLAAVKEAAKDREQLTVIAIEARDHIYTRQDIDRVREMAACALKAVTEGAKQ